MLRLCDVRGGYPKSEVLRGVSIEIKCGELLCIIGRNGCGKTTLIKTAAGILKPSGGRILCGDKELYRMKPKERGKSIAYLSQGQSVPDMTVSDAVLHGRFPYLSYPARYSADDREIALSAMERLGIADLRDRPVSQLSGGMRQRVYIAMAICQGADCILLDEPAAYLDIDGQIELMKILKSLAEEGKAVAAVMHDLTMAFTHADKIALMNDGVISLFGTPAEVSRSDELTEVFSVACEAGDDGFYRYKY